MPVAIPSLHSTDAAVSEKEIPRTSLHSDKYVRFNALKELGGDQKVLRAALDHIEQVFQHIPPNRYEPATVGRSRCMGRLDILPNERKIVWRAPEDYDKVSGLGLTSYDIGEFNPDCPGLRRYFPTLDEATRSNDLLEKMIWLDFDKVKWTKEELARPITVGVHFLRMKPTEGRTVVGTPDHLHQDGERATFCHLVSRQNIVGGDSAIATVSRVGTRPGDEGYPADSILARFRLEKSLDSWGGIDAEVSHYVAPVRADDPRRESSRHLIVIGFEYAESTVSSEGSS
ncbi:hypothetical protein HDU89_008278 [Geranomyces variabilis]|nr:hypothetical protein HDU89_008278 [Geranomyces variabilis]